LLYTTGGKYLILSRNNVLSKTYLTQYNFSGGSEAEIDITSINSTINSGNLFVYNNELYLQRKSTPPSTFRITFPNTITQVYSNGPIVSEGFSQIQSCINLGLLNSSSFNLLADYSSVSFIAEFKIVSDSIQQTNTIITFTNLLPKLNGEITTINSSITISAGTISGSTKVVIDDEYSDYVGVSEFTNIVIYSEEVFSYSISTEFEFEKTVEVEYSIENTCESDPKWDALSNNIAFRLCGEPNNPQIGVRVLRFTGGCETTGTCSNSGVSYTTGYTVIDYCSPPIYPYCESINPAYLDEEHWFQVDFVWERYTWLDVCDLYYRGGLGDITEKQLLQSLANNSVALISPPYTRGTEDLEVEIVQLNEKWLIDEHYRKGRLKIYIKNWRSF